MYRVVVVAKVREYYLVEADNEEQAVQIAKDGFVNPVLSEPIPETGEVEEVEEVE